MQIELTNKGSGLLRAVLISAWLCASLAFVGYCTFRPQSTTPTFFPFASLFDKLADGRTLVMVLAILTPLTLATADRKYNARRRFLVFGVAAIILSFEIAQYWIPHRTFKPIDILYVLLPAVVLEAAVMLYIESRFE